jgi:pyridoxal/pyridoxine/pyridoxamine kinase
VASKRLQRLRLQATVLTPNAFETELLTGLPCTTEEEGLAGPGAALSFCTLTCCQP